VNDDLVIEVVTKPIGLQRGSKWSELRRMLLSLGPNESIRVPLGTVVNPTATLAMPNHGKVRARTLPDGQYIWFEKNGAAK
jgi:hypothetical protein